MYYLRSSYIFISTTWTYQIFPEASFRSLNNPQWNKMNFAIPRDIPYTVILYIIICFTIHIRFSKFVVLSWKSYTLPHGWSEMFQVTGKSQVIDRAYKKIIHPPKSTFLPQRGCSLYTISIHKEWRIGKAKTFASIVDALGIQIFIHIRNISPKEPHANPEDTYSICI